MKNVALRILMLMSVLFSCTDKDGTVKRISLAPEASIEADRRRAMEIAFDKVEFLFGGPDSTRVLTWKSHKGSGRLELVHGSEVAFHKMYGTRELFTGDLAMAELSKIFDDPAALISWIKNYRHGKMLQGPGVSLCGHFIQYNIAAVSELKPTELPLPADEPSTEKTAEEQTGAVQSISIYGILKDDSTRAPLPFISVTVKQDGGNYAQDYTACSGDYSFVLPCGHDYDLVFAGPSYTAKTVRIEGKNIPPEGGGYDMNMDGTLFHTPAYGNFDFMSEPIAIARYNAADSSLEFDMEHTEAMMERIKVERGKNRAP